MEDVRERINFQLKMDPAAVHKAMFSPLFNDRDVISKTLVGLHMLKGTVALNKPIFIGQAVLDYSKLEMYKLFYETIKPTPLIRQINLIAGDTDSFFLEFKVDEGVDRDRVFEEWKEKQSHMKERNKHSNHSTFNKPKKKLSIVRSKLA